MSHAQGTTNRAANAEASGTNGSAGRCAHRANGNPSRTALIHRAQAATHEVSAPERAAAEAADATAELRRVMTECGDLFEASPILAHVAAFADSRSAERYATLTGVLLHVVLAVPPHVVLPPTIGGEVSLNLLAAASGVSGGGKGTNDKAAAEALRFMSGGRRPVARQPMIPLGSGEGLNRTYAIARKDPHGSGRSVMTWLTDRALFGARDVASIGALTDRRGSTLLSELLKAFMGEELGFANADADRRVMLPMHSYRLCLSVGVQPENGAVLLGEQAQRDGVPQRFLWTPVRPGVRRPRRPAHDAGVDPITVPIPDFGIDPFSALTEEEESDPYDPASRTLVPLDVAEVIQQEIIDADAAKDLDPFGRSDDPLAGHRLLTRENVAAALALLHNETTVTVERWQQAGRLIEVSTAVVRAISAESGTAAEADAKRLGVLDGHRRAAAESTKDAAQLRAVAAKIESYLVKHPGWNAASDVKKAVAYRHRDFYDDAQLALENTGRVVGRASEYKGRTVVHLRIADQGN